MNDPAVVTLPSRMTSPTSDAVLKATDKVEHTRGEVILDAGRCEFFTPMGATLLCLALARRAVNGHPTVDFRTPMNDRVVRYLHSIGFMRFLLARDERSVEVGGDAASGTYTIRHLTTLNVNYVRQLADLMASHVAQTPEQVAHFVALSLNELLQNVFEHARSAVGCFVQAQWYREQEHVRIAVVDGGIGIPAALRSKQIQGLQRRTDAEVIEAAITRRGLTSRSGRPGGLGLKTIREIVTERSGTLTVISHRAKVEFGASGSRIPKTSAPHFRGTAIELDFRPGQSVPSSEEVF